MFLYTVTQNPLLGRCKEDMEFMVIICTNTPTNMCGTVFFPYSRGVKLNRTGGQNSKWLWHLDNIKEKRDAETSALFLCSKVSASKTRYLEVIKIQYIYKMVNDSVLIKKGPHEDACFIVLVHLERLYKPCSYPGIPPASILLATVTSVDHTSYCQRFCPSTPPRTVPLCTPTRMSTSVFVFSLTYLQLVDKATTFNKKTKKKQNMTIKNSALIKAWSPQPHSHVGQWTSKGTTYKKIYSFVCNPHNVRIITINPSLIISHCQSLFSLFPGWCHIKSITAINESPYLTCGTGPTPGTFPYPNPS